MKQIAALSIAILLAAPAAADSLTARVAQALGVPVPREPIVMYVPRKRLEVCRRGARVPVGCFLPPRLVLVAKGHLKADVILRHELGHYVLYAAGKPWRHSDIEAHRSVLVAERVR